MCDNDDDAEQGELTAMAARFIAETNAFLDQFWADPECRWPLKGNATEAAASPHAACAARAKPAPERVTSVGLAAMPELIAKLKRLHEPLRLGDASVGAACASAEGAEPGVYLILLLVPEPPASAAAEVRATTASAKRTPVAPPRDGRTPAVDPPRPSRGKRARTRACANAATPL